MLYTKEDTKKSYYSDSIEYICVHCGDSFQAIYISKYCSQRCANDAYIAKRREKGQLKRAKAKNCIICDASVEQHASGHVKIRLYCSDACKQKAYRQRKMSCGNK